MTLYDYTTANPIGPATPEQIAASYDAENDSGVILIDAAGDVIDGSDWAARQPGARRVYVDA